MQISTSVNSNLMHPPSLAYTAVQWHWQAYRTCCVPLNLFHSFAAQRIAPSVNQIKNKIRSCLDRNLYKAANKVKKFVLEFSLTGHKNIILARHEKNLKSIELIKMQLGKESIQCRFSHALALYVNALAPRYFADALGHLPRLSENYVLYQMGYFIRYVNYQLNRQLNYKNRLVSSEIIQDMQEKLSGLNHQLAYSLLTPVFLSSILNVEQLFLQIFAKMAALPAKDNQLLIRKLINTLCRSLNNQKKVNFFLNNFCFESKEESFIARLAWHKKHHLLPDGIPDPDLIRLTPANLQEEMDQKMNAYFEGQIKPLLAKVCPSNLKTGALGLLYFFEGEEALIKGLSSLITQLGVRQLTDPHLFAIAILLSLDVETMPYELDGFGLDKKEVILEKGQEMMRKAAAPFYNPKSIIELFHLTHLKNAPSSLTSILQKKQAKEKLKKCIAQLIYQALKPGQIQTPESSLIMIRKKMQNLPLIGSATLSLHLLINGAFFSLGYLFRGEDKKTSSYFSWMIQRLVGRNLVNHLAEKVIELIYHPSWPITLMQLFNDLFDSLNKKEKLNKQANAQNLQEDMQGIVQFLIEHFLSGLNFPFQEQMGNLSNQLSGEEILKQFSENPLPQEPSTLEKGLSSVLPMIKELLLYSRVLESFRKESVIFEGDAKFWEFFVRESLHVLVVNQKIKNQALQTAEIREKIIDRLLACTSREMRLILSKLPDYHPLNEKDWIFFPREENLIRPIDESFFNVNI